MNQYVLSYWEDIKLIDESDVPYIKRNACNLIGFYTKFCHLIYQQFLDTGEWQCGEAGMLGLFGISDKTFTRYIKALEQLGLIEVKRAKYDPKENKRNYANIYRVTGMSDPYRTERQENKPQAAEEPRSKRVKEQPVQVNKAIETKDDELERAAYCVGNDDEFDSIITEDKGVYNDEPEKDSNPNPPKTNDKAIESQPEVKDETPTPHIAKTGLSDKRAGDIALKLIGFGMNQSDWLRALKSGSRRQVNLCKGPYMGFLSQDDRDYLDDHIDNMFKAA